MVKTTDNKSQHRAHPYIFFVFGFILFSGVYLHGFSEPTKGPTEDNKELTPIDVGGVSQVKIGGLSVNAFVDSGAGLVKEEATFTDTVLGGSPTVSRGDVLVGETNRTVDLSIYNWLFADLHRTSWVAHSQPDLEPLCADREGRIVICPLGEVRVTSSLPGTSITNIGGIPGFSLPAVEPLRSIEAGEVFDGTHDAFEGVISLTLSSASPFIDGNVALTLDAKLVDCIRVPKQNPNAVPTGSTVYSFRSRTIPRAQEIHVSANTGMTGCRQP